MVSYKRNVWYNLSCLLQTYCCLSIIEKLRYLTVFLRPMVRNQLWQWLEEGCCKPVVGVWAATGRPALTGQFDAQRPRLGSRVLAVCLLGSRGFIHDQHVLVAVFILVLDNWHQWLESWLFLCVPCACLAAGGSGRSHTTLHTVNDKKPERSHTTLHTVNNMKSGRSHTTLHTVNN